MSSYNRVIITKIYLPCRSKEVEKNIITMQSRRILITFNNNKYRTLDKTCIETREMLLRDKISLISISCVICFTKVGHLCCWRLQRHRGFGRDRNKNAISVVFSSTVKPGIRLAQFSFPFRSVQPSSCCGGWFRCLITYVRTCVCSYVYQRDESRVCICQRIVGNGFVTRVEIIAFR